MKELYGELNRRGYAMDGMYNLIKGIPVQFLPDSPDLVAEALREAVTIAFDDVETRVPTAEHLE